MKLIEIFQDLFEEAKLRTIYWALCVFAVSYFLTNTSKSVWMNVPISILLVAALRVLFNELEFRWKARKLHQQTYLSHLEKKQLFMDDSRPSTPLPPPKRKRKIDSPLVEAAMEEFVNKLLKDFVVDLWYSDITPDKEVPELIRAIIMDVLREISGRVKEINLVDLLTKDLIDLVGVHLDLFRRNQAAIGVDVMGTLTSEERDERLKHNLIAANELHPALISPVCEYKVLQKFFSGVLAIVLRPREAHCLLVRCIARELVTCLVMQPVMNFASPGYINELIEYIILATKDDGGEEVVNHHSANVAVYNHDQDVTADRVGYEESTLTKNTSSHDKGSDIISSRMSKKTEASLDAPGNFFPSTLCEEPTNPRPADWAQKLEVTTQRRTEVLMPENLENMWTKGRNYKKKVQKNAKGGCPVDEEKVPTSLATIGNTSGLRRSSSTSPLKVKPPKSKTFISDGGGPVISEFYTPDFGRHGEVRNLKSGSEMVFRSEGLHVPKLRSRVIGAFFHKLGSKSFAVYSIAVTDADKNIWFVERRYRNFERLHRHLKDIPNYTLHLPPKRIFSSNMEDTFVRQRCILLDKYLQELLSISNVAEQHEVWDFLSVSSKSYSFGKSSAVMRTLAVNLDDAMDDILRHSKGVSVPSSSPHEASASISVRNPSWNADDISRRVSLQDTLGSAKFFSDKEEGDKDETHSHKEVGTSGANDWHLDNELNSKEFSPGVVKWDFNIRSLDSEKKLASEVKFGVPPEWAPPNLSVPMLNLVDKIFQLNRRDWLRRQVYWISKQVLQLMMEDAIDNWLLSQIEWLRRDDIIAEGIRWVQDVLWPDGTFFMKLNTQNDETDDDEPEQRSSQQSNVCELGSLEQQLEAARRASDVKKIIVDGAPTALVNLIGPKQYRCCAEDIYYFLQSTICLKQLAYPILELVLVSIFPEMRDLVLDVLQKMRVEPV